MSLVVELLVDSLDDWLEDGAGVGVFWVSEDSSDGEVEVVGSWELKVG